MWDHVVRWAKGWTEFESVLIPILTTIGTIVGILLSQISRLFRSRKAEEALTLAREAKDMAVENRVAIRANERRVSECYSIVISLQENMAATSRELSDSSERVLRLVEQTDHMLRSMRSDPS